MLLFARTTYRGFDLIDWPVHLAFRLDPLAALVEWIAVGAAALSLTWLGAYLLLISTALLGRFFCGWVCPLGALLDFAGPGMRRLLAGDRRALRPPAATGIAVFAGLLAASLLGLPLLGLLDPLSLLLRSLTLAIHPALDAGAKAFLAAMEGSGLPALGPATDALRDHLRPFLAFGRPAFLLAAATAMVFASVVALEALAPRFWCAHLCPLGTLLGLAARLSPLRRLRSDACGACRACEEGCPTGAALGDPADPALCLQCGGCARACPQGARRPAPSAPPLRLPGSTTRRALLASAAGGVTVALFSRARAEAREPPLDFLRPPGSKAEEEFLRRCIRCGACMRVCPRGALHPSLWEAGPEGIWTPRLVPRLGYCEYHCRLCGQVCPTGAIGYLEEGEKEKWAIGLAVFVQDRCLPYRKAQNCMVCEEHCPTNPKAIIFRDERRADPLGRERSVKIPRMVDQRCIGCGICENKCPLPGHSAILVTRELPGNLSQFY